MLRKGRNLWEEVGVGTGGSEMKWRIEENQRNLGILQLYVVICWCCFEIIHTTIVYSYYMLWYVVITCFLFAIIRNRSVLVSSSDESWKWMDMKVNMFECEGRICNCSTWCSSASCGRPRDKSNMTDVAPMWDDRCTMWMEKVVLQKRLEGLHCKT